MKKFLLLITTLLLTATLSAQVIYPSPNWRRADPSKHGFDSKKLDDVRKFVADSLRTTGLMVIVGGESIFEYGSLTRLSYIASCRKSVLAMLYGKYVEDGTINLSTTLEELGVDDVLGLMPIEKQATIKDILASRSGVYHPRSYSGDDQHLAPKRGSKKPGSYYLYNNWDFNAAGGIFEQLVGRDIYEVFQDDIAIPIGMQDFDLANQQKEGNSALSVFPAYPIIISTRDMARLGYLMLRNGKWRDQQVISETWIKEMLHTHTTKREMLISNPARDMFGYGYMWWLYDINVPALKGAYSARGAIGQYIVVIPALDMVIAHKTDNVYGRSTSGSSFHRLVLRLIDAKK